jgi:acyl dehydratase
MAATTVDGVAGVQALVGEHLGFSEWVEVTQERVAAFADATGDHQWIHLDVERARAESPFGGPVAHGYLTLALVPVLVGQIIEVTGFRLAVNYGADRVRFPSPVPVGARVRASAVLDEARLLEGGVHLQLTVTLEVDGAEKPCCVATVLSRRYL